MHRQAAALDAHPEAFAAAGDKKLLVFAVVSESEPFE